jgi:hypothetical protein
MSIALPVNAGDNLPTLRAHNILAGLMGTAGKQPVYKVDDAPINTDPSKLDLAKDFTKRTESKLNFIPVWHGTVEYGPSFVANTIEKLQLASCQDLARYLKVVGFKKAHVTKLMAAQLLTASILAAKRDNKFNDQVNSAIMCGGMTDRWYNRMPGTVCEDTRRLKEILCCFEIAYTELKKDMDTQYSRIDAAYRPVFGLSQKSDCPVTQFMARDSTTGDAIGCVDIPPLMIAVFEQEAASIEAGQRVAKEAFTGMIYDGATEEQALWHFENIAELQRTTYKNLVDILQKAVFSERGIGLRFPGGTSGKNAAIGTIKKLSKGVMEHGKLVFGPVRQALGFISDKRGPAGEYIVTPLACECERLAFWIVSQLEIFYDASMLLAREMMKSSTVSWTLVKEENLALVKSIMMDMIKTINASTAPDLIEAVTMLTILVQGAVDMAAAQLSANTSFRTTHSKVQRWGSAAAAAARAPAGAPASRGYKTQDVSLRLSEQQTKAASYASATPSPGGRRR